MSNTAASPLRAEASSRAGATRSANASVTAQAPSIIGALAPIMLVVLVAYLIIGLAMPVLPLYVHQELGLSTFMVGVAAGIEFAAALVSRFWSGRYAEFAALLFAERGWSSAWIAFTAFLDFSLGLANPALGLVATRTGLGSVFLVSAVVVLSAALVATQLLRVRYQGISFRS